MKNVMSNVLFVLGAADPEMNAIEAILDAKGYNVLYAKKDGKRVHPGNAYKADTIHTLEHIEDIVFVECNGYTSLPSYTIDHHNPGDEGYGRDPSEFFEASSIGQVCIKYGVEPTEEHRMLAAADHCLSAAYQGKCPGIDPDALYSFRLAGRAEFQKRPVLDLLIDGRTALEMLKSAQEINIGTEENPVMVLNLLETKVPELPDAQARLGVSVICKGLPNPRESRIKVNVMGSEIACKAFLEIYVPKNRLTDSYGDPKRGIVGAYQYFKVSQNLSEEKPSDRSENPPTQR